MRILLDTHAFPWWLAGSPRLVETARRAIADDDNDVLISAASAWARTGHAREPGREGESPMKKLIQAARSAFGVRTRPAPPASDEFKRRETDRRIVSNLRSGNVRLQQGQFTTREDIDRERERVLARKL